MIRFGNIRPLMVIWFLVALTLCTAGDSFGQRRGYGGGGGYSAPVYRPTPPRPMTPAPRPMVPANSNMAPRPMTPSITGPRMPAPANSNVRGPSGQPGMSSQAGRTLPTKLATAPVAQVPSYTGRVTVKGAPIVVTKAGATYSIPEKGVFSTKTVQRFQFVRNTLVRHLADGKIAVLQTRITKYASAPQLVTTRIAANDSRKGRGEDSGSGGKPPGAGGSGGNPGAGGPSLKSKFALADSPFNQGRIAKASEIKSWAERQGWKPQQSPTGPLKYVDANGYARVTIKSGSARTPGSERPHIELRNEKDETVDIYGNKVTRRSLANHTEIVLD